jgi:predicted transcriptional regulator
MTDTTDDGWPESYSDPRDRPHPAVLRVTLETGADARAAAVDAANSVSDGEATPAVVSFESVADLRTILTDRRIELLRTLVDTDGAADSISALSDRLDRDYRPVHDDVTLLADYGLLFVIEDGRSKRPYVPYDRIHLDVELVGDASDEEPAPV